MKTVSYTVDWLLNVPKGDCLVVLICNLKQSRNNKENGDFHVVDKSVDTGQHLGRFALKTALII